MPPTAGRLVSALLLLASVSTPTSAQVAPATQATPTQAQAAADPRLAALNRLFAATTLDAAWFAPDFLAQVPLPTIQAQWNALRAAYGSFVRLEVADGAPQTISAVYERGRLRVTLASVDAQGRLTGFGAVPEQPSQALTPEQHQAGVTALTDLLSELPLKTARLDPGFLAAVPDLAAQIARLREQFGALDRVTATDDGWTLNFTGGTVNIVGLRLNDQGQITALRLGSARRTFATVQQARDALAALPGQVSLTVQEPGQPPRIDLNADRPLGVGSAFKLAILAELQAQIGAGQRQWPDQVTLTDAARSLPSGTLQDAPTGSRYSLRDLSERMIRDSDNTATDLLLGTVGRAGVAARLGQAALPSTREFFALKNPANAELLRAYRTATLDPAARRAVLAQAATAPLPPATLFAGAPVARDVEWFVSTRRLCALMNEVAALPQTTLNPGVADPSAFARVSFKGGSEPGVLNLTTQITGRSGRTTCVSATWNAPDPLDQTQFLAIYAGLLDLLR